MNVRTIELDISKTGVGSCVRLGQGDRGGTTIRALIYDNGAELPLDGASAWLVVLLPNRRNYYRGQCSVSGNAATIKVDESKLCSVAGYTDEAYFTVTIDGNTYSTERFALEILRSALDGQQPAENWDSAVQDIVDRGDAAVKDAHESASAARSAAADANDAAERAEAAASSVDDAKTNAETAAEAANAAKEGADSAASAANAAATKANASATAADAAKESAEKAAIAANADQARNNADQAANNAAAQGLQVVILADGQYDEATRKPTVEGQVGKLYFVPIGKTGDDSYVEWMHIDDRWEHVGMSNATIVGLTTGEIDRVASGDPLTSESVLNGTGLAYLWAKAKAAFAAVGHKHSAADLTSGSIPATRIADASITGEKIAANSVTSDKLAQDIRDSIADLKHDTGWVRLWDDDKNHCHARRIGGIVYVRSEVSRGFIPGVGDWKAFTVLPAGMRPESTVYVAGSDLTGENTVNVRIVPGGTISAISGAANVAYWTFSAAFPAA